MSYYTKVSFTFDDEVPEIEEVIVRARTYLEARGDEIAVEFVLEQLRTNLEEEEGDFKGLWSDDIEAMMEHVSVGFPGLNFYVRGWGEEFSDMNGTSRVVTPSAAIVFAPHVAGPS